jgi:hypothetical protein
MGDLMRRYLVPALLSRELPVPDCDPLRVLHMPNELAESGFRTRVTATAYPCRQRGDIAWTC